MTKLPNMTTGIPALRRAKDILRKQSVLAEVVGVTQPSVAYMLRSGKKVPAEWCLKIEQATKGAVTCHELRPDLYPRKDLQT
jgi:DNA-binding transcriptional regulator YdaS (Cro superfamily)